MNTPPTPTTVYTDGSCIGNPGPGGWAWITPDGQQNSGHTPDTTNQRMELTAALQAAQTLPHPLTIVTDSAYISNCFKNHWWKNWIKNNWKTSRKKPVANRDLWEPLIKIHQQHPLTVKWVKGHSTDYWNDQADQLAHQAATTPPTNPQTQQPDTTHPQPKPTKPTLF